jgi:6-pyruvoyltetrahydropterin/6-carboxytetrahydropterin synthase
LAPALLFPLGREAFNMDEKHNPAKVTRRYRFAASHRLHSDRLSANENRRVFGKCNNPNGHGHNYILSVTVQDIGKGIDIDLLDRAVADAVVTRFDHRDLNLDPGFADQVTTGENLVRFIWGLLVKHIPSGELDKVGLVETRDNYFEYSEPLAHS